MLLERASMSPAPMLSDYRISTVSGPPLPIESSPIANLIPSAVSTILMLYRGSAHRYLKRFVKGRANDTKIGRYSLASHRTCSVVVNLCIPQRSLCPWLGQYSGDNSLYRLQRIGVAWTCMAAALERMRCHDERHCVSKCRVFLERNNSGRCLGRGKHADQCARDDFAGFSRAARERSERKHSPR